jgi:hypothetical protein
MLYLNLYIRTVCLTLLFSFSHYKSNSQTQKRVNTLAEPKLILVELNTAHKQIAMYIKRGNTEYANMAAKDADAVIKCMIADFTDHFTFCPVYYFLDTNAHLILQRKMDNILFDKNLQPVQMPAISDDEYRIVKYGYNVRTTSENSPSIQSVNQAGGIQKKLMVLTPDYTTLPDREPDGRKFPNNISPRKLNPKYNYSSNKLNIYYKQSAKLLNNAYNRYFD